MKFSAIPVNIYKMKQIIIASTSTVHGSGYLEYLLPQIEYLFSKSSTILFVPYARPGGISHEAYTNTAKKAFSKIGKSVKGIHEYNHPIDAIKNAEGIFVGGGNSFLLVKQLYKYNLLLAIKNSLSMGVPYLGTSAGSNICGLSIGTTNDMPIVYPPSFNALGILPFNINPHYIDPEPSSKHMGETRETRIKEFHKFNTLPVIGLREGSYLYINDEKIILKGDLSARIFKHDLTPYEIESGSDLSDLN